MGKLRYLDEFGVFKDFNPEEFNGEPEKVKTPQRPCKVDSPTSVSSFSSKRNLPPKEELGKMLMVEVRALAKSLNKQFKPTTTKSEIIARILDESN